MRATYDVLVIGAGLTGLTLAHRLRKRGRRVLVLERSDFPGGVIQSGREEGFLWEAGPNSILVKEPAVAAFLDGELKLGSRTVTSSPDAAKRFIVRRGRTHAVPTSPWSAIRTPLFSLGGKLRVLGEPFRPRGRDSEESVASFVRRRLGPEFLDYAIGPLVSGIYAGDPEALAVEHAFPKVHALEIRSGSLIRGALALKRERRRAGIPAFKSVLQSFDDGLGVLPATLAAELGEALELSITVEKIRQEATSGIWSVTARRRDGTFLNEQAHHCVFTVPTHQWSTLPTESGLTTALACIPQPIHPPVATMAVGFRREDVAHPLDGFGMLIPRREKEPILGAIFASSLFPGRAPDGHVLLMLFLGGVTDPERGELTTEEAWAAARPSLQRLLGVSGEPVFLRHTRWPRAIPQYNRGHGAFLDALEATERQFPGLSLRGNFRGGPGLSDVIAQSLRFADHLDRKIAT